MQAKTFERELRDKSLWITTIARNQYPNCVQGRLQQEPSMPDEGEAQVIESAQQGVEGITDDREHGCHRPQKRRSSCIDRRKQTWVLMQTRSPIRAGFGGGTSCERLKS